MKKAVATVVVLVAFVCGLGTMVLAGGDQNKERHRKQWSGTKPQAGDCLHTRDRDRDRDRDGSCKIEDGDQARDRDRDRNRDGSCKE